MAIREKFLIKAVLLLGFALVSCVVQGEEHSYSLDFGGRRGLVDTGARVFDVTKFGAKAHVKTDNAQKFIKTWVKACGSGGPAKVVIPAGTFQTGPVIFEGPCNDTVVVEVQGTVKASTEISDYPEGDWILFEKIDGLVLTGGGTFDGQGASAWKYNDCRLNPDCQLLPTSIKFNHVNNSLVCWINSINSKAFHMDVLFSNNVTIHNVNITAPGDSPNTGGIHISSSNLVNISTSNIGTGDDCVSIGQGSTNVFISKIICGPGHGISIGSLGKSPEEKDVARITVTNCTISNTTNGLRIKTWPASHALQASGIFFEDIIMDKVQNPIIIDQKYGSRKPEILQPSLVKISNVHFRNIRGTSSSNVAVALQCSSVVPCEGVEFVDINLSYNGPTLKALPFLSSMCLNAKVKFWGKLNPPACL